MVKVIGNSGVSKLVTLIKNAINSKQDKVTGTSGQVLGFNENGELVAMNAVTETQYNTLVNNVVSGLEDINGEIVEE